MKPRERRETGEMDLFRSGLDQIINMNHELVRLAKTVSWEAIDAYGPRVPIGGGAWLGKDIFKADRAGGIHARSIAKLAVMTGLCEEALVRLLWFPGDRTRRVLPVECGRTHSIPTKGLEALLDLSLARSGQNFGGVPDLIRLARWCMRHSFETSTQLAAVTSGMTTLSAWRQSLEVPVGGLPILSCRRIPLHAGLARQSRSIGLCWRVYLLIYTT
jgi:hypothetical protein